MSFYFFNSLYSILAGFGFAFGCSKPFQGEIRKFFGKDTEKLKTRLGDIRSTLEGYKEDAKNRKEIIKGESAIYDNSPKVNAVISEIESTVEEYENANELLKSEKEIKEKTNNFSTISFCSALIAVIFLGIGAITRALDPFSRYMSLEAIGYSELLFVAFVFVLFIMDYKFFQKEVSIKYGVYFVSLIGVGCFFHYKMQTDITPLFDFKKLASLDGINIDYDFLPPIQMSLSTKNNGMFNNSIVYGSAIVLSLHYFLYFLRTITYIPLFFSKEKSNIKILENKLPLIEEKLADLKRDDDCITFVSS